MWSKGLFSFCVLVCLVGAAAADHLPFTGLANLEAAPDLQGVVIADVDGDGHNDLVTASYEVDSICVLLSNGDGSFQPAVNYFALSSPYDLVSGDLNGDDAIDLIVRGNGDLVVLLNDGSADFTTQVPITNSHYIGHIALGDVDNDDNLDLVVAYYDYLFDSVGVFINKGDATFDPAVMYRAGEYQNGVTIADFNGDTYNDIFIANYSEDSVSMLFNDGSGGFEPVVRYGVSGRPARVAAGDFDGDTYVDVAIALYDDYEVIIYTNDGSGALSAGASYPYEHSIAELLAGDLNGDNVPDLAIGTETVQVLLNDGSGVFGAADSYVAAYEPYYIAIGHLDGDGFAEIAAVAQPYSYDDPGIIALLWNEGDGTFFYPDHLALFEQDHAICAADFNNDGDPDLAVSSWWLGANDTLTILLNDGSGGYSRHDNVVLPLRAWSLYPADFNGDTYDDIVVGYSDNAIDYVTVVLNNGDGTFGTPANVTVGSRPYFTYAADFNNDGDIDIAAACYNSSQVSVLLNNGDGTFAAVVNYTVASAPYQIHGGLIDDDAFVDLVVAQRATDNVEILFNNGDGTFPSTAIESVGSYPEHVHVADLDNDGLDDIVASNYDSDDICVMINGSGGVFTKTFYPVGNEPGMIVAAHLNGDGLMDLAVLNDGSYNFSVLYNTGSGVFADALAFGMSSEDQDDFTTADYDGDGDVDIIVANYSDGTIAFFENRDNLLTDVDNPWVSPLPTRHELSQNFPNPFNPATTIKYQVTAQAPVRLDVFNLLGQRVTTLVDMTRPAGSYRAVWDGTDDAGRHMASGVYFYRLQVGEFSESKKMILLK